ncbi:hypothetical protein ACA910_006361 [Epithemia clementina (nom. ined.)]
MMSSNTSSYNNYSPSPPYSSFYFQKAARNMKRKPSRTLCWKPLGCFIILVLGILLTFASPSSASSPSPSSQQTPMVLRIRQLDGSIQRIQFEEGQSSSSLTLQQVIEKSRQILSAAEVSEALTDQEEKECALQFGKYCLPLVQTDSEEEDESKLRQKTLEELGIRHGSLLTLAPKTNLGKPKGGLQPKPKEKKAATTTAKTDRWDPYPDLAKDYEAALRQVERRKRNAGKLSFADLSELHRSLHVVEAQPAAALHRLYLCPTVAERFATAVQPKPSSSSSSSSLSSPTSSVPRVALLLGTIHKERRHPKKKRAAKTSLSSTTESEDYCQVAKVQAVWEPPQQPSKQQQSLLCYDASELLQLREKHPQVLNVAQWLGLVPVGWMYSYSEDRHGNDKEKQKKKRHKDDGDSSEGGALPVFGLDVKTGARLQIEFMKHLGREDGQRFVTVAMHGPTGATEAFQFSNVAVQMVAEDMLMVEDLEGGSKNDMATPQRFVPTRHAFLVDGRETTTLDSVLCLVNTALLQQQGSFVGQVSGGGTSSSSSGVKSNNPYQLTKKMRKALVQAASSSTPGALLELLCNFQVLVAVSQDLPQDEMQALVETVRKFARGLKKTTTLDPGVLECLLNVLNQGS